MSKNGSMTTPGSAGYGRRRQEKDKRDVFKSPEFQAQFEGKNPLELIGEQMDQFLLSLFRIEETFEYNSWAYDYIRKSISPNYDEATAHYHKVLDQLRRALPSEKRDLATEFDSAAADFWVAEQDVGKAIAFMFGMKIAGSSPEEIKKHCQVWKLHGKV